MKPYDRPEKNKPYGVRWTADCSRKTKFFKTKRERDNYIRDAKRAIKEHGTGILELSAAEAEIMREGIKLLGSAAEVQIAINRYYQETRVIKIKTIDAIQEFINQKTNEGLDDNYVRNMKNILNRMQVDCCLNEINLTEVTNKQLSSWLFGLPYVPRTVKNYIKNLSTFFSWSQKQQYLTKSPIAGIDPPKVIDKEPEFLTVDQVNKILNHAKQRKPDTLAYFTLGFFAGLRSSACARIGLEHIRFNQRGILITAENAKNGRRQFVDGHEPILWDWLNYAKDKHPEGFEMSKRNWDRWRPIIASEVGVKLPKNALRHSFCTYHVALHGDAGKTATLLTHRGNVSILYEHYKGNASKNEARDYFNIKP